MNPHHPLVAQRARRGLKEIRSYDSLQGEARLEAVSKLPFWQIVHSVFRGFSPHQGVLKRLLNCEEKERKNVAIAQPPPPEVLALIAADHIYRDESTGKLFILGTRSAFGAAAFPFHCSNLAVYASMIDGRGETALRVRLVDVDEAREPVLEHETTVDFHDPTEEVEVVFHLEDLVFPEPGDYRLQIHGAGQFLRERRLLIIPLENPGRR